jgi:dolichyl-phosphate-mannose--protein O-mannosyl transferase
MKLTKEETQGFYAIIIIDIIATCAMYVMLNNGFDTWIDEVRFVIVVLYVVVLIMSFVVYSLVFITKRMSEEEFNKK